jgi:hypothetical protein
MPVIIKENGNEHHIPTRYLPKTLSKRDRNLQLRTLKKSRKSYKKGVFIARPKLASFVSRKSGHVATARRLYGVASMAVTPELVRKTGCSAKGMREIISKGDGAYYSSGSRPSQTAKSWSYARLASSLTGGPASCVDYAILSENCHPRRSRALRLAKRACNRAKPTL